MRKAGVLPSVLALERTHVEVTDLLVSANSPPEYIR